MERGARAPSLDTVARLFESLGIEAELVTRAPFLIDGERQHDAVHALCGAYIQRRLRRLQMPVEREVEVVHGRTHGWIDLLAFEPRTRTALIIEIKTQLDDLGRIERTMAWYEREAWAACRRYRWRPARVARWLLLLATDAVETRLAENSSALALAMPGRARVLDRWLHEPTSSEPPARALALIDPRSRRRTWLLRSRIDGRRTPSPYRNYADFVSRPP